MKRAVNRHLHDVDVLHTHIASSITAFAVQTAKRRGIPVLCKVATAGIKSDLGNLAAVGIGGNSLAQSMIKNLDCWVATTQAVVDSLCGKGVPLERITCIPNGVDFPASDNRTKEKRAVRRFLYLGRMARTAQRDVPTLIRAFDLIADQYLFL